jgi:hypothetical protein
MHPTLMVIKLKAWNYDKKNQTIETLLFVSSLNEQLQILEMVISASMLSQELDWTKS